MKKIMAVIALVALSVVAVSGAYAATSATQNASATVGSILSIEFASTTDTVFGSGGIPWTSVDASAGACIRPTGYSASKTDTGVKCKYNGTGTNWYLKMAATGTLAGKIKYYMGQPTNSNTSTTTNGTLAVTPPGAGVDWPVVAGTAATAYTSGTNDTQNTPFGTFVGINYGLNPTGLVSGTSYSGVITYTITTTP